MAPADMTWAEVPVRARTKTMVRTDLTICSRTWERLVAVTLPRPRKYPRMTEETQTSMIEGERACNVPCTPSILMM